MILPGVISQFSRAVAGTPYVTAQTLGSPQTAFAGAVGMKFEAANPGVTLVSVGAWCPAGGSGSRTLWLGTLDGSTPANFTILQTKTLNMAAASDDYAYVALTPVALTPGTVYCIMREVQLADSYYEAAVTDFDNTFCANAPSDVYSLVSPPTTATENLTVHSLGPVNVQK